MFSDFQTKTPVSKNWYAYLASNSMTLVYKRKESLSTQFFFQLPQFFCGILQSCRLRCCAFKYFLFFEELFDAKLLLIGHDKTQNYVLIVLQSEATINSND